MRMCRGLKFQDLGSSALFIAVLQVRARSPPLGSI